MNVDCTTQKKTLQVLKWIAVFGIPILLWLIPEKGVYTEEVKKFLCVTVWAVILFGTELVDTTIVSLLLMIGYVMIGLAPIEVIFSPWTQDLPWMMIGGFILVAVIQRTTILKRIAYWCVIITGGTYRGIVFGVLILGMIACILIPSTAAAVGVAAIACGICQALELGKSKESAGIILAGMTGFMESYLFIYSPTFISIIFTTIKEVYPTDMNYITFFLHNAIFIPYIFIVGFLITKMVKPKRTIYDKAIFIKRKEELGKITLEEKKILVVFLGLVIYLLTYQWHGLNMTYGFLVAPALLYFPGFRAGKAEDLKEVNYGAVIFIAACMSIGAAANVAGIGDIVADAMYPYLSEMSPTLFLTSIWLLVVVLNFVMTPVAEMAALGVPLTMICLNRGMNPLAMCYTVFQGGSQLLLPYEVTMWLVAFGFGLIYLKDFIKICGMKMAVCIIYLLCIGIPYWRLIGLL